jgi:hypothetical protein
MISAQALHSVSFLFLPTMRIRSQSPAGIVSIVSHYLFDYHFCLVRRANEKGVVEGTVKYSRLNFLVPVPQVRDFDELNALLLQRCREDMQRRVRGQVQTKDKLLLEEQLSFLPLPFCPFEACRTQPGRVNTELLVRFDNNDYSVPMEYAHQDVVVKGYRINGLLGIMPLDRARPTSLGAGALTAQRTGPTGRGRTGVFIRLTLFLVLATRERLARRTTIGVVLQIVDELLDPEDALVPGTLGVGQRQIRHVADHCSLSKYTLCKHTKVMDLPYGHTSIFVIRCSISTTAATD